MFEGRIRIAGHQISLFDSRSGLPSQDWNATQRKQGFAWQPGSVSFYLPENAEMAFVVEVDKSYRPDPAARTIIAVPFKVEEGATLVLGSHGSTPALPVPPGNYDLYFEYDGSMVTLIFVPATSTLPTPEVIRDADAFEARMLDHYTRYLGPVAQDWRDRTPGWPMRLVAFDGTPARNERFFATCGLGQHDARMPDGCNLHCELIFATHQDAPMDDVVRMMLGVSELVGRSKDALLAGDVIKFTASILPGTQLTGLYCTMPVFCLPGFASLEPADGGAPIIMIWLIPVYECEKAYIKTHGRRRFEEELDRLDPDLLDLHRQPIGSVSGT